MAVKKKTVRKLVKDNGKDVLVEVTYDRCKLYYNQQEGSFYYQPYDLKHEEFFQEPPSKDWERLGREETSLEKAQPFTDIMDAMKLLFGREEFNLKRMQALWEAYNGKHEIFGTKIGGYFFPVNNKNN